MSKRFGGLQGRYWRHIFLRRFCAQVRPIAGGDAGRWSQRSATREAEAIYDARTTAEPGSQRAYDPDDVLAHPGGVPRGARTYRRRHGRVWRSEGGDGADVAQADESHGPRVSQAVSRPGGQAVEDELHHAWPPQLWRHRWCSTRRRASGTWTCSCGAAHFTSSSCDHGVPGLTLTLCNWDRNWMQLLDDSNRPVRSRAAFDHFDRRGLLPISVCAGGRQGSNADGRYCA